MAKSKKKEIVYPIPKAELYHGDSPLTIAAAKELIGWAEEPEGEDWGEIYVKEIHKLLGIKVRLINNTSNRILVTGALRKYLQDILQRCWRFNMDSIVIGKYGQIMSGQHRLLALILAEYTRLKDIEHWKKTQPDELTMECLIGFGVEETDDVFRTLNVGATATVADTLFRSQMMSSVTFVDRKGIAKIMERSVNVLWERLGYKRDQWAPVQTTSESYMFIEDHPSLLECAIHIHALSLGDGFSSLKIPTGTATALMYLQSVGNSDAEAYHLARFKGKASEKLLNLDAHQSAADFWTGITAGTGEYANVQGALSNYQDAGCSTDVMVATVINAWNKQQDGESLKDVTVDLVQIEGSEPPRYFVETSYKILGLDKGELDYKDSGEEAGGDDQTAPDPEENTRANGKPKKWKRTKQWLEKLTEENEGHLLIFRGEDYCVMYGEHAMQASPVLVIDLEDGGDKLKQITFPLDELDLQAGNLVRTGFTVRIVGGEHNEIIEDFVVEEPKKKSPAKKKKKAAAAAK